MKVRVCYDDGDGLLEAKEYEPFAGYARVADKKRATVGQGWRMSL